MASIETSFGFQSLSILRFRSNVNRAAESRAVHTLVCNMYFPASTRRSTLQHHLNRIHIHLLLGDLSSAFRLPPNSRPSSSVCPFGRHQSLGLRTLFHLA